MKLTIANTEIRQDAQGRYNLSDLHRASGGNNRHRPSLWLANKQAKELIAEISEQESLLRTKNLEAGIPASKFGPVATVKGHGITATYVVWQLVYAYAMWISPKFHLHVIETFHDLQTRPRIQHEKALTARYPFYIPLRQLALEGKKDVEIAPLIERSAGSVGYHRKKQFTEGFTDPVEYAYKRYAVATAEKVIAKQGWDQWGSDYEPEQASFNFEFGVKK